MNSKKIDNTSFNVNNEAFSDKLYDPSVIDSAACIDLEFTDDLDMSTVSNAVRLFNVKSDFKEHEVDVVAKPKDNSNNILQIGLEDDKKFTEGELFKLSIDQSRALELDGGYVEKK